MLKAVKLSRLEAYLICPISDKEVCIDICKACGHHMSFHEKWKDSYVVCETEDLAKIRRGKA